MARVIIDLPTHFVFSTEVPIYIGHINHGHHLDNAALLALVSETRTRFFRFLGYAELDVEGVGVVVADAAVHYKSEAFYGETLVFEMTPADFNRYGCDFVWRARDKASGREVARGKNGIVFFDYQARRPTPVPPAFVARVESLKV